jgi:uncharacterized protein (DUF58 family)
VAAFLLAQQTSDNDAGGALLTLWFLLGLFIIVAAVLWVLYARPHRRVPPRPPARAHGASSTATAVPPGSPPEPGAADSGGHR